MRTFSLRIPASLAFALVATQATPALAADYSLTCDLGPPGIANFSLFATSNGIPHSNCRSGCSATDATGAQVQFNCTFSIQSGDSNAWKCGDVLSNRNNPPYSNPALLYLGDDPCP
jgi:hypothetical protein